MLPELIDQFEAETRALFSQQYKALVKGIDRIFAVFLLGQYAMAVALALYLSPLSWAGAESSVHVHVLAALLLGGLITVPPVFLVLNQPGEAVNRFVITVSQICFSILFIHLTGGRIETHFHIFGSIAFLAFYRDWRLVTLATVIIATDHFLRGMLWPESVYGVALATPWRSLEHAGWVCFEDIFIFFAIRNSIQELSEAAGKQVRLARAMAELEELNRGLESKVEERTEQWRAAELKLAHAAKMSALGEMAGSVAHEINNPLAVIQLISSQVVDLVQQEKFDTQLVRTLCGKVLRTSERIARIVKGMRTFSRDSTRDPFTPVKARTLIDEVVGLSQERFQNLGVALKLGVIADDLVFDGRATQLSQVLLNLLNNACDAVSEIAEKWIEIEVARAGSIVEFRITDSGQRIPEETRKKVFQPFFTTKMVGKGTGMGLSISLGLVEAHQGKIFLDESSPHTCFVVQLPLRHVSAEKTAA